jgi:hypothetical protein
MVSASTLSANSAILAPSCHLHQFFFSLWGTRKGGEGGGANSNEKKCGILCYYSDMIYLQNESKGIFICSHFNIKYLFKIMKHVLKGQSTESFL